MKKMLIAGAVLVAAGVGYYAFKPGGMGTSMSMVSAAAGPLDYVPADTAFVVANVESMPKDVTRAWMDQFASVSGIYAMQAKMLEQELAKKGADANGLNWTRALFAEFKDRNAEQVMAELGVDMQMRYALYAVGARPVMRFELADASKTRAFIARVEQQAGEKVPTAKVDQLEYWNFVAEGDKARIVAAIDGSQLVLAFLTGGSDDAALRDVLGLNKPKQSIAAAGTLAQVNREFGYTPYTSGFVDTRKLLALVDDAQADSAEPETETSKAACAADYDAIAKAVPRVVFGYTRFEAKSMQGSMLLELRPDIAKDLQPLPAPMPGLDATAGSMLNFGFSMNIDALANFVNKQADAVIAAPYTCPALVELNDGARKAKEQFSSPMLYATAAAFNSIHVIATRFTMPKPGVEAAGESPEFAGKLLVGSKNPAGLMGMLSGFAPQIAALKLRPDGELKEMPADPTMPVKGPMHAVMTDAAIGVSVGEGESASLKQALAADANSKTLLAFGYGAAFFQAIFDSAMVDLAKSEDPNAAEMRKSMEALQKMYAESIDRLDVQVRAGERGIEMVQDVRLK